MNHGTCSWEMTHRSVTYAQMRCTHDKQTVHFCEMVVSPVSNDIFKEQGKQRMSKETTKQPHTDPSTRSTLLHITAGRAHSVALPSGKIDELGVKSSSTF